MDNSKEKKEKKGDQEKIQPINWHPLLKKRTRGELLEIAEKLDMEPPSSLSKKELIQRIEKNLQERPAGFSPPDTLFLRRDEALPSFDFEDLVLLLPQNPRVGYIYWELSKRTRSQLRGFFENDNNKGKNFKWVLRLCGLSPDQNFRNPDFYVDYALDPEKESFYIRVPRPDYHYQAVLGLNSPLNEFLEISHSEPIHFPRNFVNYTTPVHFMDLPRAKVKPGVENFDKFDHEIKNLATIDFEKISRREQKSHSQPLASQSQHSLENKPNPNQPSQELTPGSSEMNYLEGLPSSQEFQGFTPPAENLPSSEVFFPQERQELPSSIEFIPLPGLTSSEEYLIPGPDYFPLSPISSGEFLQPLPSSGEFIIPLGHYPGSQIENLPSSESLFQGGLGIPLQESPLEPFNPFQPLYPSDEPDTMFLEARTEIRIFGRTNPDAILEINGKYFPTNSDGSFAFSLPLPDSEKGFDIHSRRKSMWRRITKQVVKSSSREGFE